VAFYFDYWYNIVILKKIINKHKGQKIINITNMIKTIFVVVSVLLIIASFAFGMFWGEKSITQSLSVEAKQINSLRATNLLQSISFGVNGKVSAIDGRILTLERDGTVYTAEISSDAKVNLITTNKGGENNFSSEMDDSSFDAIKIGDDVTVTMNGTTFEGFNLVGKVVTILVVNN
jgi:hypothetical protein